MSVAVVDVPAQANLFAILFRRIGDSLLATPALRALKKRYPDTRLHVVAEPQIARVFHLNPWIDEIITVPTGPSPWALTNALRCHGRPDIVVDFLSDPRSALGGWISRGKCRVGIADGLRRFLFTSCVAPQDTNHPLYSADHKLTLAQALDAKPDGLHTDFFLTDGDMEFAQREWQARHWDAQVPVIAFFVHSRRDYKRWPLERFAHVIRALRSENSAEPLVLVTPGDEQAVTTLRQTDVVPPSSFLPLSDLGQLGAVLKQCRLFVGNDGGPKHIAVALDVPTLAIFGREPFAYWTPPNSPQHVALASTLRDNISEWPAADLVLETVRNMLRNTI